MNKMIDFLGWNDIVRAVCWTLVYSLWEGLMAALLTAIIIVSTRKSSARIRYNLLSGILILFLTGCGLTFFYLLRPAFIYYNDPQSISGPVIHLISSTVLPDSDLLRKSSAIRAFIIQIINEHASWLVTGWFVWMLWQTAWMSSGIFRINQILHQKVSPVPAYWAEKIAKLSARLGIRRKVTLIESGIIKTPVVAGHFKPFILVPLGMLTSLPADQVETILLHELAHVFRRDYLTNLLLHFAKTVFFFNPFIRWVIALIGQEREACCDDIVLNATVGKTHAYLEALLAFEVYATRDLRFGIQLAGRGNHLLARVKRIIYKENRKLNKMEKILLSVCILVIISFGFKKPSQVIASVQATDSVRVGFKNFSVNMHQDYGNKVMHVMANGTDGKIYEMDKINEEISGFLVNHQMIEKTSYKEYAQIIKDMNSAVIQIYAQRSILDSKKPSLPHAPAPPPPPPIPLPISSSSSIAGAPAISETLKAASIPPAPTSTPVAPEVNQNIKDILLMMHELHLITNDDIAFDLTGEFLILDGMKVSPETYQKFQKEFIKNPTDHYTYYKNGGTVRCEVSVK